MNIIWELKLPMVYMLETWKHLEAIKNSDSDGNKIYQKFRVNQSFFFMEM